MIINLELNSFKYNGLMIKNLSYLASIFAGSTKKGKKYNEDLIVMQLNLNCYEKNTDNALSQYQLQEVNTHKLYCKNISIFDLNVEKCNELYYNLDNKGDIPNYARWGALLYCKDFDEIPNIVNGLISKEECDKIMSKLNKLTDDSYFMTKVEAMEWAEWERNSIEE